MTEERVHYWFNRDTRRIHKDSCDSCLMDYYGNEKDWGDLPGNRNYWWGPYVTVGAAVDAGLTTGHTVRSASCCSSLLERILPVSLPG